MLLSWRRSVLTLMILSASCADADAQDLSAETMAAVHDLLAPYRGTTLPAGPNVDPAALRQALGILEAEQLLDFPRPSVRSQSIAQALGRALELGTSTQRFLGEVGRIRDSVVRQDAAEAKKEINALYTKMGRAPADQAALERILKAVTAVVGDEPNATEQVTIERPGYSVAVENAQAAGKVKVVVRQEQGADGRPARVEFSGRMTSRPDEESKDLETVVEPAAEPETMTSSRSDALRSKLNGRWHDKDGTEYEITGDGNVLTLTEFLSDGRRHAYHGEYDLATIDATFAITTANDLNPDLPLPVRQQLADMDISFRIMLNVTDQGAKLDGTWSSQHVTYDASSRKVESIGQPYALQLVLHRLTMSVYFTDADFQRLSEVELFVIEAAGIGFGEVWVEAVATADDTAFDDTVVDRVVVRVWSDTDSRGQRIECVETAPGSRIFRSSNAVALVGADAEISP